MKLSCFRKTLNINENKPEASKRLENIKTWCIKSNRPLSAAFAFLAFFLMVLFISYCNFKSVCIIRNRQNNSYYITSKCFLANSVTITCENITRGYLVEEIDKAISVLRTDDCVNIIIKNYYFENTTLKKGWLSNRKFCIKILELNKINIKDLGQEVFHGKPFEALYELILANTNITVLRKNSFDGAKISILHFYNDFYENILTAESGALNGISKTLQFLKIRGCLKKEETISNLTAKSDAVFTKLQVIDFSHNKLTNLGSDSFKSAVNLETLLLNNNHLTSINKETFNHLYNFNYLDLSHNNLTTIREEVFLHMNTSLKTIILNNNPWHCNCSLNWLKKLYIKRTVFNKTLYCENYKKNFDQVYFCNNTKEETETEIPLVEKYCKVTAKWHITHLSDKNTISIRAQKFNFSTYEEVGPKIVITIKTKANTTGLHLIWLDVKSKFEQVCIEMENKTTVLEDLERGHTYVFCLFEENDEEMSPLDCSSIKISLENDDLSWIVQSRKYWFIGINLIIFCGTVVLSALFMFYYIRKNPKILRNNKRLVVMDDKAVKAIVLPKNNTKLHDSQSFISNSQGYLVPKGLKIIVKDPFRRRISNDSVHSETVSYASAHYGESTLETETRSNLDVF